MSSQVNLNNLQVSGISITDSVSLSPAAKASMTSQLSLSSGASMIGGNIYSSKNFTSICGLFSSSSASRIPFDCNISNLFVSLGLSPGALLEDGKSYTFTVLKNNADTNLTVTISGFNTNGSITGVANSTSFAFGDKFQIKSVPTTGTNIPNADCNVSWTAKLTSA